MWAGTQEMRRNQSLENWEQLSQGVKELVQKPWGGNKFRMFQALKKGQCGKVMSKKVREIAKDLINRAHDKKFRRPL